MPRQVQWLSERRGSLTSSKAKSPPAAVVKITAQVIEGPLNPACHWDTGGTGCTPPAP